MTFTQLLQDINFLCGSTSASYANTDKTRNINIEYQNVARLIWESEGGWQYDDSNMNTLPIAKTSLFHNQQDYSLPSTAQQLQQVEIKDNGGTWHKLKPFDLHDTGLALPEYLKGSGLPLEYDLVGRSLMLYPTPSSAWCTLASGMAVYVQRDVTEFATSATTAAPGFATPFHRILSYAASIDFVQDPIMKKDYEMRKARLELGLTRFYSKRAIEEPTLMRPRIKKNWQQYT